MTRFTGLRTKTSQQEHEQELYTLADWPLRSGIFFTTFLTCVENSAVQEEMDMSDSESRPLTEPQQANKMGQGKEQSRR